MPKRIGKGRRTMECRLFVLVNVGEPWTVSLPVKGSTSSNCKGPRSIAVSTGVTMARAPGTGFWRVILVEARLQDRSRDLVQCTLIWARGCWRQLAPRPSGLEEVCDRPGSCPQRSKSVHRTTVADDGSVCSTSLRLKLDNVEEESTAAACRSRVRVSP
jgi:hypothetical protein